MYTIYSKPSCGYCLQAKPIFEMLSDYIANNIEIKEEYDEW